MGPLENYTHPPTRALPGLVLVTALHPLGLLPGDEHFRQRNSLISDLWL